MGETRSTAARRRLREEMERRHLNQTDIAGILAWTQSRISKILNGKIQLGLDELAEICFALDLSIVEAVRDHGLEFCAEMAPTELRFLERIRQLSPSEREALMTMLHVAANTKLQERRASPPKEKRHKFTA